MNRRAKYFAAAAIVAFASAFGLGQDKSDDSSIHELQVAPSVVIATLDVDKVFKKSQKFNAAMAPIRAKLEAFDAGRMHIKKEEVPPPHKKEALSAETKSYAETYQRMNEIVTRICQARNIQLVIRATVYSVDSADRGSVLQGVNRQIVYSNVPDITDEVIAELNR